ncbi:MAG: type II toxin-antitoxin system RelE/ParE family toxin [Luteolibacter sp.]
MAYKIIWSPISRDDLRDLVRYISADNPLRAQSFALQLIAKVNGLQNFPEIGRIVPERKDPLIREIIFHSYRIVYRINHQEKLIGVARVWHAARAEPDLEED